MATKKLTAKKRAPQRSPKTKKGGAKLRLLPSAPLDDGEMFPKTDPFDARLSDEDPPDIE